MTFFHRLCIEIPRGLCRESVTLITRNCDGGIDQRWDFNEDGTISAACNSNIILALNTLQYSVVTSRRCDISTINSFRITQEPNMHFFVRSRFYNVIYITKPIEKGTRKDKKEGKSNEVEILRDEESQNVSNLADSEVETESKGESEIEKENDTERAFDIECQTIFRIQGLQWTMAEKKRPNSTGNFVMLWTFTMFPGGYFQIQNFQTR